MYQQNNNLNKILQDILNAKKQGKNPQELMSSMFPQIPQRQQTMAQLKNMSNGRTPKEFLLQLAKQNGAEEVTLSLLNEIFDN